MGLLNRFVPLVGLLTVLVATPAHAAIELTAYDYAPGSKYGGISVQSLGFEKGGAAGRFLVEARDTVTFAPSTFYAFCIDVTTDLFTYSPYTSSSLIPGISDASKLAQVAAIMFHSGAALDAVGTADEKNSVSAALQLAIWEILYEPTASDYSIADGNFSVFYDFDPLITLTDSFLANVESGTWTGDATTLRALVSQTGTSQNLIYQVNTAAVPEPASWALMILGFGFVGAALRRRRELGAALVA
jgi:hypothetical protein